MHLRSLPVVVRFKNSRKGRTMTTSINSSGKQKKRLPGRPKKGIRRTVIVMVRLNQAERILAEDKAKQAGVKVSELFRLSIRNARIVARFSVEQIGWYRKLTGMANNLNQLARQANAAGMVSLATACRAMLKEIDELVTKFKGHDREANNR